MPSGPKSAAISRVSAANAAFEVAYAAPAKGGTREPAMEVTLTTEPLAALSSSNRPRASMIGAKKFTRNTWSQTSTVVSIEERRVAPLALGEIAALLTSACSSPFSRRCLMSARAGGGEGAVGTGKIDLDMISGPHFQGAILRERVARAGNHAPPGRRKSLNSGMADATARSSEQEGAARLVRVRRRHEGHIPKP